MSFINVKNLKFKYPHNNNYTVDDVSFVIAKGSYTAIVGYNGSGKSTVAKLLCGLETPESGSIEIEENNRIGIVFQSPKDQLVSSIVSRDTAFGPQNLGLPSSEVELRTIESLNIVDMLDRAHSSSSALSLGQTQKIALSGVLAIRPEILIMDEAISMLDPVSRKEILDFVEYWHKCGNTVIQITHDMEVVEAADNIICMENGRVVFYGTKEAFLADDNNVHRINGEPLPVLDKELYNPQENDCTLSLEDISFNYSDADKHGVKKLSFKLYKGSLTALTGPSGAGKSTILELCSGLLKPDSGKILCNSRPALAQQNASAALFENFAADDVAFGPLNSGINGKDLKELVRKAMDTAALPFNEFADRRTMAMSGGEQRRLAIAGIIALNKDVVLFDEPTAGLDSKARFEVLQMMRSLAAEGKTVFFSTHKRDEADFADREIVIENGCLISDSLKIDEERKCTMKELSVSDSSNLLSGLRSVSLGLSGTRRKKLTPIQKLPSALRMIVFLTLFIVSMLFGQVWTCGVMLGVTCLYAILCGFSLKKFLNAGIKILPFLLIFTVFQLIFHPALPDEVHFTNWRWFTITPSKLLFCLASIMRTFSGLGLISSFFVSTPEYDLIDGLKILLKPLALIKIPVHHFILIIEVIFRFIPLLVDEACAIIKTQIIRGGLGKVDGKMAKIKAIVPLAVPLIIQTIKRSESLATAITMRCFK